MKGFLTLLVLVALCLLGIGLYRGWFSVSTEKKDEKPTISVSVDQQKIKEDEEKAKKKLQDLEHQVKEKASGKSDPAKEK